MKIIILILLLAAAAFAQSELPDHGSIADLKGKTKFYVIGDSEVRDKVTSEMRRVPELKSVASPDEAEFFIEYKALSDMSSGAMQIERGEMTVYVMRGKQKIVAWSKVASNGAFKAATAGKLAGQLASALKKIQI